MKKRPLGKRIPMKTLKKAIAFMEKNKVPPDTCPTCGGEVYYIVDGKKKCA